MIFRGLHLRYGCKNFKNHMGIRDNVTLAGIIKRSERRNPRFFNFIKGATLVCSLYFIAMSFLPGSQQPLQASIKQTIYAFSLFTSKIWNYNPFDPKASQYLININELILTAMDNQIYNLKFLEKHLLQIKQVAEESKRQLKKDNYLDLLLYSQIFLQNIVRFQKQLLLQRSIIDYYEWIFTITFQKLKNQKLTQNQGKHIKLIYIVIQYLLNFGGKQKIPQYIHKYYQLVKQSPKTQDHQVDRYFEYLVMKRGLDQKQFKNSLMHFYSQFQNLSTKQQILAIFQNIDKVFNYQNSKKQSDSNLKTQKSPAGPNQQP